MGKTVMNELSYIIHPRNIRKIRFEGKVVEHDMLRSINVFMAAYLAIFVISVLVVSLDNFDGVTNFSAVASAINNVGPGLNLVGPTRNFSIYSNLSKLMLTFDMLAGRLEIFPMLILCLKIRGRKRWS